MAFWQRKGGRYVFVYTMKNGKQQSLPRTKTKHLDGEPDHNVAAWVAQYTAQFEHSHIQADSILYSDDDLSRYIEDFTAYRHSRGRDARMVTSHRNLLRDYVIPFFLRQNPPLKDPNQWPAVSIKLLQHLKDKELSVSSIQHANNALRKFWEYLLDERIVLQNMELRLRAPVTVRAVTPLKFTLAPAEALSWITSCSSRDMRLMALLGYFFSLRPQETLALYKRDFRTGSRVEALECYKAVKAVLPDNCPKLALHVQFQRVQTKGEMKTPKADSKGWVACFSQRAGELLINELRDIGPDEMLFSRFLPTWNLKRWAKGGMPDYTLKDLRRASLYWLGHTANMPPMSLKAHARHARFETTELYLRRPVEDLEEYQELDLDA